MVIERILLDLDDVCNLLTMTCLKHVGCDVSPYNDSIYPVETGFNITAACNILHPTKKDWGEIEFWNSIPRNLWATAPLSSECYRIIELCVDYVGVENIFIATSPTKDPDCLAGKLEWIQTYLPGYLHRQYLITPRKWLCADRKTLLIDDSDDNVKSFREHGGKAILVPRPWNVMHKYRGMDIIGYVKDSLTFL